MARNSISVGVSDSEYASHILQGQNLSHSVKPRFGKASHQEMEAERVAQAVPAKTFSLVVNERNPHIHMHIHTRTLRTWSNVIRLCTETHR